MWAVLRRHGDALFISRAASAFYLWSSDRFQTLLFIFFHAFMIFIPYAQSWKQILSDYCNIFHRGALESLSATFYVYFTNIYIIWDKRNMENNMDYIKKYI